MMNVENILRMINNKEYKNINTGSMPLVNWYTLGLDNDKIIRITEFMNIPSIKNKSRGHINVTYFESNKMVNSWSFEHGKEDNEYFIFKDIMRQFETEI